MTPEEAAQYNRQYYLAHKAEMNARSRAWKKNNPEVLKAYQQAYYAKNKDQLLAKAREWAQRNPEKVLKYSRKKHLKYAESENRRARERYHADPRKKAAASKRWMAKNPLKARQYVEARRARIAGAEGHHTAAEASQIRKRQKNKCAVCGTGLGRRGHLDHIQALTNGGSNWARNLQWLCASCNCSKGARDEIEFMREQGRLL